MARGSVSNVDNTNNNKGKKAQLRAVKWPFREDYMDKKLVSEWVAHVDLISGMTFCTRFERRTFLITASTDCSVALWTLYGVKVGVFGQELRWKLELVNRDAGMVSLVSTDTSPVQVPADGTPDQEETKDSRDSDESIATPVPEFRVDNIEPFPEDAPLNDICSILSGYRINAWKHTMLGKEYQEVRIAKRQRKQPQSITDLPSVAGERYSKPNYGPYYYLQLSAFDSVEELQQPDFMDRPEEYFMDKDDLNSLSNPAELPVSEDSECAILPL
ncbi:uncharacterized protein DEA37_0007492 [Paragonimus westermani]|uniref:Uncharacterized protein n=1 Tax=Paragonimus westermani TaxID=34504 RepID=A0A5J4NB21_9TREM|nr:uncharacterized protein DEA37_0007492 [Paragonimus westermani]